MGEPENITALVNALRKVPPKKLLIIELANSIPIKNGQLDYNELVKRQAEISLAIQEAKNYGNGTLRAVDCLIRVKAVNE